MIYVRLLMTLTPFFAVQSPSKSNLPKTDCFSTWQFHLYTKLIVSRASLHIAAECIYSANSFSATVLPPRHHHFSAFIIINMVS